MLASLSNIWLELTSVLMSFILSFGTLFGIFQSPSTAPSDGYKEAEIKNVIFLIGDGMGFNHLNKTEKERELSLTIDKFDIGGESMTRSLSAAVTDSAAGGTALATGERTSNGAIGVYMFDLFATYSYPKSITELCKESGMMTGVITTDETSGATPASFSAHAYDRGDAEDITSDQMASGFDLIWGTENGIATKADAEANGFTYVTTYAEMMALPEGSRSFAQFTNALWTLQQSDENTPTLSQMTEKAIDLLDDTDEGFFLMVEGAHIDKHSHSNEDDNMTEAMAEFDKAIKIALDYAKADGETLVVVTADHETGAITPENGGYVFTRGSHSDANVPVRVYGADKLIYKGEVLNNYEIPIRIAYTLGFTEDEFPCEVMVAA